MSDRTPSINFMSEDDLGTFEGWAKYQAIDLESPYGRRTRRGASDVRRRQPATRYGAKGRVLDM